MVEVDMSDDFTGLIPEGSVVLNVLRIVEYMVPSGEIFRHDLSYSSDGEDLDPGSASQLIAWAQAFNIFPMIAPMIHDYVYGDEEEGVE
jgi:hypothetical protein